MHKKVAIACAIGALCSAAHAQSSVSVFGVLDLTLVNARATGNGSITAVNPDGNSSNRLGFRGEEDLGGGMKASFFIEAAVNPDTGTGGGTSPDNKTTVNTGGLTLARRSTVALSGSFGEIRLGRDYTPTFINLTPAAHPIGTNGVGSSAQLFFPVAAGGTTPRTNTRASNALNYLSPEIGGFSANVMVAVGEQPSTPAATKNDGNYLGARIAFRGGPLSISGATGKTKYATGNYTQSNVGLVYRVGDARLYYLWGENKVGVTKTAANMLGLQYVVGALGEIRATYTTLKASGVANDASQIAVGYVHNLSKRSAVYTNYSVVDNKGTGRQFVVGGSGIPAVLTPGGNSSGFEVGLRTSF